MNKYITLMALALLITAGSAQAQHSYTNVSYSIGFGAGDLGNFIPKTSWRGASVDYLRLVQPNVGVGIHLGWNTFYEALDFDTYSLNNLSISGQQWRYSNHFPMMVTANYYLSPKDNFNPFVGLGLGTMYSRRNTDMNLYTIELNSWHFALQPRIGFQYTTNHSTAFEVSARYNHGFRSGQIEAPQGYFSLNVGLTFIEW
jgi:opacity protein-like surface antigen